MTATEAPAAPDQTSARQSPWMSVTQVAEYSGYCYDTVLLACQAYMSGDRTPKALKTSQRGHKSRHKILRPDVDRWVQGQSPSRATRVA